MALILELAAAAGDVDDSRREELIELSNEELRRRAKAAGAAAHVLENVADAEDPKLVLVAFLLDLLRLDDVAAAK